MLGAWWAWAALALVLGVAELMLPGHILLGFAIGAALVSVQVLLGILGTSMGWTLAVFAILSLCAWVVLRALLGSHEGQVKIWDRDINED